MWRLGPRTKGELETGNTVEEVAQIAHKAMKIQRSGKT